VTVSVAEDLMASQQRIASRMRGLDAEGAPQMGEWTVRDVAAHLAACDSECFEPRVREMASGERPRFEFYSNDDRDFGDVELAAALDDWSAARARLCGFVRDLSGDELNRVGVHDEFGKITIERYLEIALEHDREHLEALEQSASGLAR
jgi:hypothetical protein